MVNMYLSSSIILRNDLFRIRKIIEESNLLIIGDKVESLYVALNSVKLNRQILKDYIFKHPEYLYSLEQVKVTESAPRLVKMAASASEVVNVGPMAAIPGALAEIAVEEMLSQGGLVNIAENGGEIAASSNKPLIIGIYAGKTPFSGRVGLQLSENDFPIGVATSSATVSHAINFGEADAVVIISNSAAYSDAIATAVSNIVRGPDIEASVQSGLELVEKIPSIRSAIIIRGKYVGKIGRLPKLVKLKGEQNDMFKASIYDIYQDSIVL